MTDPVKVYLAEIAHYEVLTWGEEKTATRQRLIEGTLRFAVKKAQLYSELYRLDIVDTISAANVGLCKAADSFDWKRGLRFASYAAWKIKSEVRSLLRSSMGMSVSDHAMRTGQVNIVRMPLLDDQGYISTLPFWIDYGNCVARLPEVQKKIVTLRSEGYSNKQIQAVLDISKNTCDYQFAKAKKQLNDVLKNHGDRRSD